MPRKTKADLETKVKELEEWKAKAKETAERIAEARQEELHYLKDSLKRCEKETTGLAIIAVIASAGIFALLLFLLLGTL